MEQAQNAERERAAWQRAAGWAACSPDSRSSGRVMSEIVKERCSERSLSPRVLERLARQETSAIAAVSWELHISARHDPPREFIASRAREAIFGSTQLLRRSLSVSSAEMVGRRTFVCRGLTQLPLGQNVRAKHALASGGGRGGCAHPNPQARAWRAMRQQKRRGRWCVSLENKFALRLRGTALIGCAASRFGGLAGWRTGRAQSPKSARGPDR